MAERYPNGNLEAALNASMQRQSDNREQSTHRHNLRLLGRDLERLLAAITQDIEEITKIVDGTDCSAEDYNNYIDKLHTTRMKLLKTLRQWEKVSGASAEEGIKTTIAFLELSSAKLVIKIKDKLEAMLPVEQPGSVAPNMESLYQSSYGKQLASSKPSKVTSKHSYKSARHSTSSSTALKLQLRTEEAAISVNEQFDRELTERDQRKLRRDAIKQAEEAKKEAAAMAERLAEETRKEAERLADEATERAEATKRKKAIVRAKLEAIESFSQGSRKNASSVISESEVAPDVKAAAYVNNIPFKTVHSRITPDINVPPSMPELVTSVPAVATTNIVSTIPRSDPVGDLMFFTPPRTVNSPPPVCTKSNLPVFAASTTVSYYSVPAQYPAFRDEASTCQTPSPNLNPPVYTAPIISNKTSWAPYHGEPVVTVQLPKISKSSDHNYGDKKTVFPTTQLTKVGNTSNYHYDEKRTVFSTQQEMFRAPLNSPIYTIAIGTGSSYINPIPAISAPRRRVESREHLPIEPVFCPPRFAGFEPAITHSGRINSTPNVDEFNQGAVSQVYTETIHRATQARSREPSETDSARYGMRPPQVVLNDNPAQANTENADRVIEAVCGQMALARIPIAVPDVFDGNDPLSFPIWRMTFDSLISNKAMTATDKLTLLNRYLGGEAKSAIKGFLMLAPSEAYEEAYNLLLARYGDKFKLASTFHERLRSWSRVSGTDIVGLRRLVDFLTQCKTAKSTLNGLDILDNESENAEIVRKLPTWLSRKWTRRVAAYRKDYEVFPSFCEFVEFLTKEDRIANDPLARTLQKSETIKNQTRGGSFASESRGTAGAGHNFGTCSFCKERHFIDICEQFRAKPFEFRQRFVRENGLCFSCLNRGHLSRDCKSRVFCEVCQNRHSTVMHRDGSDLERPAAAISATNCASNNRVGSTIRKSSMILPVYVSHISNPDKRSVVYAMIDTQSDTSFITDSTARELGLVGKEVRLSLSTLTASDKIVKCTRYAGLSIRGFNKQEEISLPPVFSRKSIPVNRDHIPCPEMTDGWPYLRPLKNQLMPRVNCEVGLLIGYDCPKAQAPLQVISADDANGPFGMRNALGWGLVGLIDRNPEVPADAIGHSYRIAATQITGSQVILPRRTKEISSPTDCLKILESDFADRTHNEEGNSLDEKAFLNIMEEGIQVDTTGHYSMPLPFNQQKVKLFNNRQLVAHRMSSLRRKLDRNPAFREEYVGFMGEMVEKGFAEEVNDPVGGTDKPVWYIPHFGVFHKTKKKLRVVFDCSARYRDVSLNDALYKGPDYINSLAGILCRFRKHPIAFSCDVEKMFYAFHVHVADRDFLRFLWWKGGNTSRQASVYRMTTHLFGAVSSPACATFGLRFMAREFPNHGQDVLNFINEDFYVDDGLKSIWSEKEAVSLVGRTIALCNTRGIRLNKFSSNSKVLLDSLPDSECAIKGDLLNLDLDECITERVLGVLWDIKTDSFRFKVITNRTPLSRREILSVTSSIFDPLGWIAPFTLRARLVLQRICRGVRDWDEDVPQPMLDNWNAWYREASDLSELSIKRCWQDEHYSKLRIVQLHHFADASEDAYGACSYLRTIDSIGRISVVLVMAKARVAPLASITIPRLELMAAVVAARLSIILDKELRLDCVSHHFWTDSKIVLGYLRNDSKRFKIFVANRIQEIHDISKTSQWGHVSGLDNPADLASRGMKAVDLNNSSLWFHGPPFLHQEYIESTNTEYEVVDCDDPELRRVSSYVTETREALDIFNFSLFASWKSLTRGVARAKSLARQYKNRLSIKAGQRSAADETSEPLSVSDLQFAEQLVVTTVQLSYFPEELETLRSGEKLLRSSELRRLDCFLDCSGILRVGGRLRFTSLYSALKHPIVLPKGAHVSSLLIHDCHSATKHQGRGMTINEVRARGYWIIGLNGLVKKLIQNCVTCRALRGAMSGQKMADLPADRAECSPPFTYCGVDIFGPFLVKERRSEVKRYGAIFTCLASRAVHIEMTYNLTTDSFIQTLRKFMALRGPVRLLRCDNGTNFVGANKELVRSFQAIQSDRLRNFALNNNCELEFRTNPPSASHMGGVWERLIRVVRSVLSAILDQYSTRLDDCSLGTLFYEVAAVVNTRPLSLEHVTDPDHPEPLTPNHLLTGKSKIILPPPGEFSQGDAYSVKRWRCVQFLADQFWQRWRREYLQYLQQRNKWQRGRRGLKVGDIVLISDANSPRNEWKRGVVTDVFISQDGLVRSVQLRIGKREDNEASVLTRPIHKLVLLLPCEGTTGDRITSNDRTEDEDT